MRFVISVYVENKYGVLARVSGLFMRRGFNINSLTVDETDDAAFSRITITLNGDENDKDQLVNQLKKLHNVKVVRELHKATSIERELMLIKVKNSRENRSELMQACDIFRAKIIDYSKYKYEQSRKEKEARRKQRSVEIKEIRMSPNIDTNDLNTKVGAARKFLEKGNKVKVSIRFRGREMAHTQDSRPMMDDFAAKLSDIAVVDKPPKMEGRFMTMFLAEKK